MKTAFLAVLAVLVVACQGATDAPSGLRLGDLAGDWVVRDWRFVSTVDPGHVAVHVPGPAVVRVEARLAEETILELARWADDTVALQSQRWIGSAPVDTVLVTIPGIGVMGEYVVTVRADTLRVQSAGGWPCYPFPSGCETAIETQVWVRP